MVPGQNVLSTTHPLAFSPSPVQVPSTTLPLLPQTLHASLQTVSTAGQFTVYTVRLAPHSLVEDLAVQPAQNNLPLDPSTVMVYVDASTRSVTTVPVAMGSVYRFNGLLFNDAGTLRMDTQQINDGVPQ